MLCTVDAYVNSDLKKYLKGGYPTVRTFSNGKIGGPSFVGSQSESFVRNFIDSVINKTTPPIAPNSDKSRQKFMELKTTAEFEQVIRESQVPVVVKFSAYW